MRFDFGIKWIQPHHSHFNQYWLHYPQGFRSTRLIILIFVHTFIIELQFMQLEHLVHLVCVWTLKNTVSHIMQTLSLLWSVPSNYGNCSTVVAQSYMFLKWHTSLVSSVQQGERVIVVWVCLEYRIQNNSPLPTAFLHRGKTASK